MKLIIQSMTLMMKIYLLTTSVLIDFYVYKSSTSVFLVVKSKQSTSSTFANTWLIVILMKNVKSGATPETFFIVNFSNNNKWNLAIKRSSSWAKDSTFQLMMMTVILKREFAFDYVNFDLKVVGLSLIHI